MPLSLWLTPVTVPLGWAAIHSHLNFLWSSSLEITFYPPTYKGVETPELLYLTWCWKLSIKYVSEQKHVGFDWHGSCQQFKTCVRGSTESSDDTAEESSTSATIKFSVNSSDLQSTHFLPARHKYLRAFLIRTLTGCLIHSSLNLWRSYLDSQGYREESLAASSTLQPMIKVRRVDRKTQMLSAGQGNILKSVSLYIQTSRWDFLLRLSDHLVTVLKAQRVDAYHKLFNTLPSQ